MREPKGRVLFIGMSYYNNWYLSRALRNLGWKADVLAHVGANTELYSHGQDFYLQEYVNVPTSQGRDQGLQNRMRRSVLRLLEWLSGVEQIKNIPHFQSIKDSLGKFPGGTLSKLREVVQKYLLKTWLRLWLKEIRPILVEEVRPLIDVLDKYDIVHFTGVNNLRYFHFFNPKQFGHMPICWDIQILKKLDKKIVYSTTGCLDGVSQTSFHSWSGSEPVCDICPWQNRPDVCSDQRNLGWGKLRNELCDYICNLGGNNKDYNDDPKVHEVPEFYCLDPEVWKPDLPIPQKYRLDYPANTIKLFHAVGNFETRTGVSNRNIKSTHIYLPLVERLQSEGYPVEWLFFSKMPNIELRFYQAQADIFLDMLTFGFFGATAREGMMLGKPVICYLRPAWLEAMRREIPEYVEELPIISATPETIYDVLTDLINNPEKRAEIGRRGREFAQKWHSADAAGKRFDQIYSDLLRRS